MTKDEIKAEFDAFIEWPDSKNKRTVTTTSALIFAEVIAAMAVAKEREACALAVQNHQGSLVPAVGRLYAKIIRLRVNK